MIDPIEAAAGAGPAPIRYRVRVGVTGHRSLRHPDAVAGRVSEILDSAIDRLFDEPAPRDSRVTPWAFTVVTALAEGADRLVAREVLRTPESGIEVILPLAREDYLEDFETGDSRREFDELCARATGERAIECMGGSRSGMPERGPDARGAAYLRAGRTVVERCDVLIALWDGTPARGTGGTGEIVAYAREVGRPIVIVSDEEHPTVAVQLGEPLRAGALRRMEVFNTFEPPERERRAYEENAYRGMFEASGAEAVAEGAKRAVRERLIPYYVCASLIAKRNKRRHARAGLLAYLLSPAAVAAVAIGALVHSAALVGGAVELALLATILVVLFYADRQKVHKQWIEARFVAERVRSAMFCVACGLAPSRTGVPPWLLHTGGADAWAFRAGDEIARRLGALPPADPAACAALRTFVQRVWLDEQIRFHERRSAELGGVSRWLESAGQWTFVAALGAAALHVGLTALGPGASLRTLERPVVFLALVLPAIGASIGGIRTHREYSRLERRHQAMAGILRHLRERSSAVESLEELNALLREAEGVMLQESGEWLALMRYARIQAA